MWSFGKYGVEVKKTNSKRMTNKNMTVILWLLLIKDNVKSNIILNIGKNNLNQSKIPN